MKITIVNTHDIIGGAERCSYDLASTMHRTGHDVSLIVGGKLGTDAFVKKIHYRYFDYKFRHFVHYKIGLTDTTLAAPIYNCFLWPELKNADVFNIHNMHGSFWNFWTLPILARRSPVVLTLHDEWFMTGDCAYTYDCERWLEHCGNCPQASEPERYAIGGRDATRINLALKRLCARTVPASNMVIVAPSRWLLQRAQRAPHLSKYKFHHIENGINLKVYRPFDQRECRAELKLPAEKKLIFAAAAKFYDKRKNFRLIDALLRSDGWPKDTVLVLAGRLSEEEKQKYINLPVIFLGFIESRDKMAKALSACDFTLMLSIADNLPYTGLEALACGCPIIGSNVGGIPEIVDDGVTGWFVPADCGQEELGRVVNSVVKMKPEKLKWMKQKARTKAEKHYDIIKFVDKYRMLFEELS